MPAMTIDTLKVKLKALAGVGDEAAVATLTEFDRLAAAAVPTSTTSGLGQELANAKYVLQKIDDALSLAVTLVPGLKHGEATAAIVSHAKEVAAFDKAAKEYYAQIVIAMTKLANQCRSKDRRLSVPAHDSNPGDGNELVNHFDSYIREFAQKNVRIEWLEIIYNRDTGNRAPETPADWNPGYYSSPLGEKSPAAKSDEEHKRLGLRCQRPIRELNKKWFDENWSDESKRPKELYFSEPTYSELLAYYNSSVELTAMNDLTHGMESPPYSKPHFRTIPILRLEAGDPESVAAAATRRIMGLPPVQDPAVTAANTEKPAAHYDKGDKMGHQDGNQG